LPGVTVLDKMVTAATLKAEEELHEMLGARVTPDNKKRILALLVIPEGEKITPLPRKQTAGAVAVLAVAITNPVGRHGADHRQ